MLKSFDPWLWKSGKLIKRTCQMSQTKGKKKDPDDPKDKKFDILIVDDTVENLRLLMQILKDRDYKVRAAPGGEMALTAVNSLAPDLILLDIKMPQMDGYEVCRRLKSNEATRSIPIIFISAFDDIIDQNKAGSVGGVDYITKPFRINEVYSRVAKHLPEFPGNRS